MEYWVYLFWQFFHITENAPPPKKKITRWKKKHSHWQSWRNLRSEDMCFLFPDKVLELAGNSGFDLSESQCEYIQRETINKKEDLCVPRIFVQGKFVKPKSTWLTVHQIHQIQIWTEWCHQLHVVQDRHSSNLTKSFLDESDEIQMR